jgi:hypothetical protein
MWARSKGSKRRSFAAGEARVNLVAIALQRQRRGLGDLALFAPQEGPAHDLGTGAAHLV